MKKAFLPHSSFTTEKNIRAIPAEQLHLQQPRVQGKVNREGSDGPSHFLEDTPGKLPGARGASTTCGHHTHTVPPQKLLNAKHQAVKALKDAYAFFYI